MNLPTQSLKDRDPQKESIQIDCILMEDSFEPSSAPEGFDQDFFNMASFEWHMDTRKRRRCCTYIHKARGKICGKAIKDQHATRLNITFHPDAHQRRQSTPIFCHKHASRRVQNSYLLHTIKELSTILKDSSITKK
jgi:hypothetical protein